MAPARKAGAGIELHALAVLQPVDGGVDVARPGVDGDAAAGAGGIGGFFEKTFAPGGLRRIHDGVLAKLAEVV